MILHASGQPVQLDGRSMTTKAAALAELAKALALPSWFGANWDALSDLLADEDIVSGRPLVVVAHADALLADEPGEFATFCEVLGDACDLVLAGRRIRH